MSSPFSTIVPFPHFCSSHLSSFIPLIIVSSHGIGDWSGKLRKPWQMSCWRSQLEVHKTYQAEQLTIFNSRGGPPLERSTMAASMLGLLWDFHPEIAWKSLEWSRWKGLAEDNQILIQLRNLQLRKDTTSLFYNVKTGRARPCRSVIFVPGADLYSSVNKRAWRRTPVYLDSFDSATDPLSCFFKGCGLKKTIGATVCFAAIWNYYKITY